MKLSENEKKYILEKVTILLTEDKRTKQAMNRARQVIREHFNNASWLDMVFNHQDNPEDLTYLEYMLKQFIDEFYHNPQMRAGQTMRLMPLFCKLAFEFNFQNNNPDIARLNRLRGILNHLFVLSQKGEDLSKISLDTTFDELNNVYGSAIDIEAQAEKERMANAEYVENEEYTIIGPVNFETAQKYGNESYPDSKLCYTQAKQTWDNYTANGENNAYIILKDGWEDIPPQHARGSNSPYDEYGLSMIFVFVDGEGELVYCNTRWNHKGDYPSPFSCDHAMSKEMISELIGRRFETVFKPNNSWQDKITEIQERLRNGEKPRDLFDNCWDFSDGFARVKLGRKYNFINTEGEFFFEKWFDNCGDFSDGFAVVNLNDKFNFINTNGELVSDQWFDICWGFSDGFAKVLLNDKFNFINTEGEFIFDQWFDNCWDFSDGFAVVKLGRKFNFINTEGELVSDQWFDNCGDFVNGFAKVALKYKYNFINTEGEFIFDQWFDYVSYFNDGFARVELNEKHNFINSNCELVFDQWFDYVMDFEEGFARVELNDKYNFINSNCELVSDQWFDYVMDFKEGFAKVLLNGKYNFINTEGELVSDQWFDYVSYFNDGFVEVELNDNYFYMDKNGKLHVNIPVQEKLSKNELMYIINEAKMLLTEDQESDSIKKAIALYMDRMGCDKKTAEKFVRIDLREDLPNLRYKKPGKFILGVTRMFLDGQLRQGTTIEALNTTITYVASDAHYNEYDKNLNGLSAHEIINRFADAVKADAEADKERLAQQTFTNNDNYEIVRVDTFEDTSKYNKYCYPNDQWCITKYPSMLDSYTNDGIGQFYFCLRKGFENMEPVQGEGCPKDEYGLSMIAVCVDGNGRLKNSTCRWNHSNGGNDNLFTTDEISQLIGRNFYEVFKPNNKLAEKMEELKNRLKAGENIHDVFDRVDDINGDISTVYSRSFGWNFFKHETKEIMSDKWFDYVTQKIKNGFIEVRLNNERGLFSIKDGKIYNPQDALQIITNKIEQLLQDGADVETLQNEIDFDRFYKSIVYDYVEVSCLGFYNIIENGHLKFKKWFYSLYTITIYDKNLKGEKYYRVCYGYNEKYRIINENEENVLGVEYKWIGSMISQYGTIRVTGDDGKSNIISVYDPKQYLCKRSFENDLDIAFVRKGEFVFVGKDDKGYILCDKNGKDLLGIYLDNIKPHYSNFITYCNKDGKTAILFNDDLTLTEWYDEIEIKSITDYSPCTMVSQNDKVTMINCVEKKLFPHWVDEIYNIYWSVYKVREGNLFNLIDEKNGELLSKEWFTDISFWEKDKCICIVTNKQNKQNILQYSYSNPLENEFILKNWYDKVEYFGGGSIRIENNGEQHTYTNWEYYINNV